MHRFEWPDDESVEFHLGHGDMIRLLRGCGLEVEDLLELRPEPDATTRYPFVTLEWVRQWPCEEVWKARKSFLNQPAPGRAISSVRTVGQHHHEYRWRRTLLPQVGGVHWLRQTAGAIPWTWRRRETRG